MANTVASYPIATFANSTGNAVQVPLRVRATSLHTTPPLDENKATAEDELSDNFDVLPVEFHVNNNATA